MVHLFDHRNVACNVSTEFENFITNYTHCQDPEAPEGEQYWYIESFITGDTWYERFP